MSAAHFDETAIGGLSQDDLKTIDTVRARVFQLANSIARLKGDVLVNHPLPTPDSLQASAFVLQQNFASLNEVVAQHADLLRRIVVHPDPAFPGRTEEQVLTSLLRKKLEPDVEAAAELARETAAARGIHAGSWGAGATFSKKKKAGGGEDEDEDEDEEDEEDDDDDDEDDSDADSFSSSASSPPGPRAPLGLGDTWFDARSWCIDRIDRFIRQEAADVYTQQERAAGIETVRTGLRRSLEEEEEDDDEDDEDNDEDEDQEMPDATEPQKQQTQPPPATPVEPEILLWLAARGDTDLPRYIDVETQRAAKAAASAQKR